MPNSWHRAAFIFCLCTDPGTSPGGLESGVRQFISPRLNHWFFTISTAWFRCHGALEKEVPLGDSIARSWFHLAECCGSVLSSVATPQRVPGTRSRPHFASIRPPHSRCLAPDPAPCLLASGCPTAGAWHQIQTPCLLASRLVAAGAWHQSRERDLPALRLGYRKGCLAPGLGGWFASIQACRSKCLAPGAWTRCASIPILGSQWYLAPNWASVPRRSVIGGLVDRLTRLRWLTHGLLDLLVPNAACC